MNDRAKRRRARKKLPKPPTPILTDVVLTEADLSAVAEAALALLPFPVRPWNREKLWTAVLDAQINAKTRVDRELVAEARGALQVLDAIERFFLRRDE
ncbi:hypothetical protein [Sorangium cellulosum]|uniref:hypothetical protein n=1 Tax=Sorangium cellulosum TaxID=56 RepID=UPI000A64E9C7|nr:hypothetical protein [Sorangium cellulosum]